jgi:succinate dehydrogenase/fumarate reductase flavoprotein subunit
MRMIRTPLIHVALIVAFLVAGCATSRKAYYNAWEKFGYAKRERLVDNVKDARQEQVEAKQQFANALEEFKSIVNFEGGDLEAMYNKLSKSYERSESQAGEVNEKITGVKRVADALFAEWKGEIAQIKGDPSLQQSSRKLYNQTRDNYAEMIQRMDQAAATMDPVLQRFKNRVIYIKSNLNAQAIASLAGTEVELGDDIERLIKEMEASIAEADKFIAETQGSGQS